MTDKAMIIPGAWRLVPSEAPAEISSAVSAWLDSHHDPAHPVVPMW